MWVFPGFLCVSTKGGEREREKEMAAMPRAGLGLVSLLLLALVSTSSSVCDGGRWDRRGMESREREQGERPGRGEGGQQFQVELGDPREMLKSEGGRLRAWSDEIDAIRNAHVGMAELELEQDGLLVPQYADSDKIAYVLQGSGKMGAVISGLSTEFRRSYITAVQYGDVIALPKGTVYWWYNDGDEQHRVLLAGDTSFGVNPGRFHQFGLAGSQQGKFGSVLHGFSKDTLAKAWGVDDKTVQSLLQQQNEAGIVKAKNKIRFPQIPEQTRRDREHQHQEDNTFGQRPAEAFYFEELKYSTRTVAPDFYVENGGTVYKITHHKLPALRQIGFSAVKMKLEKNAMEAPLFSSNSHQLTYFTKGSGRVQVTSGDGKTIFDQEVKKGMAITIPQFFPSLKIAGDEGLEWIVLLTSSSPSCTFLAGRNSVYNGIPKQVSAAAFNVDEQKLEEFGRDEEVIFPPRGTQREDEEKRRREEQQRRQRREDEEERRKRGVEEMPQWAVE